ncbi:hypothetical protein Q4522_21085 [Oceanobacillus profundus]|nr:hypothetical protein [Oceanobacillus profundus]
MSRLEEIKRVNSKHIKQHYGTSAVPTEDFKWLIEYVEELEKLLGFMEKQRIEMGNSHGETIKGAGMLLEINQRYKQALEDIRDITTGSAHAFAVKALEGEK